MRGMRLVLDLASEKVISALERLASSQGQLGESLLQGKAKAKKAGAITASQVCTILPMRGIMSDLDCILSGRLNAELDRFASSVPCSFLECAKKHRRVMDCTFACSLAMERSLDNMSRCTTFSAGC